MLNELIEAYESRLQSYHFLLEKLEQELMFTQDPGFTQFCECETKRLMDLVQLCEQVLADLNTLNLSQREVEPIQHEDIKNAEGE